MLREPETLAQDNNGNPIEWPVDLDGSGYRLLTEAEWEVACRGGTRTAYSFGQDRRLLERYAWYQKNSGQWSHSVVQLRPNARGLFDHHGNVKEWCQDWYDNRVTDSTDPTGDNDIEATDRVPRGSGYSAPAADCRSSDRLGHPPSTRNTALGLRLALTPSSFRAGGQQPVSEAESGGPP